MRILAVDTCLGACSVALLDGEDVLAHRHAAMERGHAEALGPMVQQAVAGFDLQSLDRLAVTVGPGTFTGQRVGLSFMRGLRLALQKPLIGVTSLQAMALAAQDESGLAKIAVLHDARRGEVYLSLIDGEIEVMPPRVLTFAQGLDAVRAFGACALAGTAATAAKDSLNDDFVLAMIRQPDALCVARLASARPTPATPPAPLYLRAPDAKLPGGREAVLPVDAGADLAALAALHAACFAQAWDGAALTGLLATPGTFGFAASSGFVLARAAAGEAEILTLAVAPAARGKGLGRALMQAAAGHAHMLGATSLFLEVGTGNLVALALYGALGFSQVGSRKGYYDGASQGGDALVLKAALPLTSPLA